MYKDIKKENATRQVISEYGTKQISYHYHGKALTFNLSQQLFSSYNIDKGSEILLESIANQIKHPVASILDIGSGTGVLAACLGHQFNNAKMTLQDRDALAVLFSRYNCIQNGMSTAETYCNLALSGTGTHKFDLIISNIPAKAGPPVHRYILMRIAGSLAEHGIAAVVVVRTLDAFFRQTLAELGYTINYYNESANHSVFHFSTYGSAFSVPENSLDFYWRDKTDFSVEGVNYTLHTAYNLPNFSRLSTAQKVLVSLLRHREVSGSVLFWNPGQGHLPVFFFRRYNTIIPFLAGRDVLEIKVSRHNIRQNGIVVQSKDITAADIRLLPVMEENRCYSHIVIQLPDAQMHFSLQDTARTLSEMLEEKGCCYVTGKSTPAARVLQAAQNYFIKIADKKTKGFRAVILQKK